MGTYRMCVCFTRRFKMTDAEPPADVKEDFKKYSEGSGNMTAEQLQKFLVEVQRDRDVSVSEAGMIVEKVLQKRYDGKNKKNTLNLDDFHHYLFSADLNSPIGDQVHQDMSAPLSHYFVYTGHNSYLTGNQFNSDCSVRPIINALTIGVRVVELDIWPNTEDSVHVKHGWTLTTPVELIECLKSIKEHAFDASPYPVIITLEDHLTPDLQAKVAKMITETFEDMLLYPDSKCLKEFPSPEDLMNRIIISTKPPKKYSKAQSMKQTGENSPTVLSSNGISSSHKGVKGKVTGSIPCGCLSCLFTHKKKKKTGHNLLEGKDSDEDERGKEPSDHPNDPEDDNTSDSDSGEHDQDAEDNVDCNLESRNPSTCTYKNLISIHAGKPKGGLKEALKTEVDKVRRLSLSEQKLENAAEAHGTDVVRFTQRNFLRVYPKGIRLDSSNYNPLIGWMHGAQMVAFNMQGYGKNLWLMQGMFRSNGGCGFVKKPDFLMKEGQDKQVFDPTVKLQVKTTLKVKVYMGDGWYLDFKHTHFDLCSPPDFYTRVGIAGVPADKSIMMETNRKEDNWTPTWDREFTFPLTVPELALLRVEVNEYDMSEKHDFAGQTCLPVWELRQGIRAVPLFDRKGEKYNSVRLLMRFEFV